MRDTERIVGYTHPGIFLEFDAGAVRRFESCVRAITGDCWRVSLHALAFKMPRKKGVDQHCQ